MEECELPTELLSQLIAFSLDQDAKVLKLPTNLTSEERKRVHKWCEVNSNLIDHESVGYGNKRYLVLRKFEVDNEEFLSLPVHLHDYKKRDLNKKGRSKDNECDNNNNNNNNYNINNNNNNYKNKNVCIIDMIPPEIFVHIFKFCDCITLNRMACTSAFFRDTAIDQSIWKILCKITFPSMFNSIMLQGIREQEQDSDSEVDWKMAYMLRHMKQQHWNSKKQKFPKTTEFGSNNNNNNNNMTGVRLKTCKRCHERFNPNQNPPTACTYHPGIFAHKDNCSTCDSRNDAKSKKVQKSALDDRINRKLRHSTKTNVNYTFVTVHGECQFEYTCCRQRLSGVIGCKQASHK